ncbi:uncharacterized protein [Haliotis cracherodii]|uniref:uncharacterized protein n=1 Tax=Haliotis cracherodii TaxID=6455 RepID=UPI0039E7B7B5
MEVSSQVQLLKQQLQDKNPNKMENLSQIPTLGDQRLCHIHRKVSRARKNIIVHNEKIKMRSDIFAKSIDRHKQTEDFLGWQRSLPVKRSLMEKRGLQKCLRRKREAASLTNHQKLLFGMYEGEDLTSFRPEIQSIIDRMHPRERRLRKVEQMKVEGKATGRLVDYNQSLDKFHTLMEDHDTFLRSSFEKLREKDRTSTPAYLTRRRSTFRLPPIGNSRVHRFNSRQQTTKAVDHLPIVSTHRRDIVQGRSDLEPVVPRANTIMT